MAEAARKRNAIKGGPGQTKKGRVENQQIPLSNIEYPTQDYLTKTIEKECANLVGVSTQSRLVFKSTMAVSVFKKVYSLISVTFVD